MSNAEIFALGFGVDTSALANGKTAADALAKSLVEVAKSMQAEEAAAKQAAAAEAAKAEAALKSAQAERSAADAALKAAQADKEKAEEARKAAEIERVKAEALATSKNATEANAAAVIHAIKALREQEAAERKAAAEAKKAAEEAKKKAEAEKAAAEAAERAANPHLRLADAMTKVGQTAQGMSAHVTAMTQGILNAGQQIGQGGGGMLGAMNGLLSSGARLAPMFGEVAVGAAAMATGIGAVATAMGGLVLATYNEQEQFAVFEARLKNVYGSAQIASVTFGDLTKMAQQNGIAIDSTAEAYLRLARNNESIGLTRKEMLALTDAVQKLGRVSGASQGELSGGLLQFSQALAAGRLNGDELRSIMENMPELTRRIAAGLGVSVGQLRAMGAEGELTAQKVVGALMSQIDAINADFKGLPDTSEQAFTRVGNAWDRLMANMGKQLGASGLITGLGNAAAAVIDSTANLVAPQSAADRIADLQAMRAYNAQDWQRGYGRGGSLEYIGPTGRGVRAERSAADEAELQRLLKEQADAASKEAADAAAGPLGAAAQIIKESLKGEQQIQQLRASIQTLDAAYKKFLENPSLFKPEQVAVLNKIPDLLAAMRTQLADSGTVMEEYREKTQRTNDALIKFGTVAIAEEVNGLIQSAAKKGENVTQEEAIAAVIARRVGQTNAQAAAMGQQIAEQERLTAAVGKGTQAQIDAEVANKAAAYQMQTYGETVDGVAKAAMDRYTEALRKLLTLQKEATEAQRLYNTQVQLGIEAQVTAAIKAGATAGEVARLRQQLQLGQQLGEATSGPASGVRLANGAAIPAPYQSAFDSASAATGIPVAVLAALAQQESGFNQAAVSPTGARGIMQILPSTARAPGYGLAGLTEDQLADPQQNIMFGAQYLAARAKSAGYNINTPEGLRATLRLYNGSDTPGGDPNYDTNVLNRLPVGGQAALAENQLSMAQAQQATIQRVAEIDRRTKEINAGIGGPSAQRQAQRDAEIRSATDNAQTPEERLQIEQALRRKFQAEDDAARQKAISDEERITAEKQREAEIAKLPPREREIERRVLERINDLKAQGLDIDQKTIDAIRAQITEQVNISHDAGANGRKQFEEAWTGTAQAIGNALNNAIGQAVMDGKIDAEKVLQGLIADITTAIFDAYVTKPLVSGLMGLIGAQGMVLGQNGPTMFLAQGGVVSSPTRRGGALIGEAGDEAVLPLRRGSDGRLGVGANGMGGGNVSVVVNDMRSGSSPAVEMDDSTGPDGRRMISLTIRDEVKSQLGSGSYDKEMRSRYGARAGVTKR